jgi:hypothetical protein
MKSRSLLAAVMLPIASFAFPAVAQTQTPEQDGSVPMPTVNWLFVQTADSITYQGGTLTLQGVSPQTVMFSDRPERMTGDASTAKFVEFWTSGKSDFEKDPPNATLSTVVDGKPQLSVIELTNPQLNGNSLTYTVKVLGDAPPASARSASLFIDWWSWHPGPRPGPWGRCWRGPYGGLHCRPAWAW